MQLLEVRMKARQFGISTSWTAKVDLIRSIQSAEGNFPCFGLARDECDRPDCCWREDCLMREIGPAPEPIDHV